MPVKPISNLKIASWNVNSIKVRQDHVKAWLEKHQPDLLLLQELKTLDMPTTPFEEIGYHVQAATQKTYNGVAILSKEPANVVCDTLPGNPDDAQARYLEITYHNIRVINIYAPNGNPVDSEKYPYKLSWMERLYEHLALLRDEEVPFLIGGDFNVIPANDDCYDPKAWEGDALFREETHAAYQRLLNLGLTDALRVHNKDAKAYTFWDYQGMAWPSNKGIRIDHFLLAPSIADSLDTRWIDAEPRALEKPSDHTPIILELSGTKGLS